MGNSYHNDDQEDRLEQQTQSEPFCEPEEYSHDRRQQDDRAYVNWERAYDKIKKDTKRFLLFDQIKLRDITQDRTDSVN